MNNGKAFSRSRYVRLELYAYTLGSTYSAFGEGIKIQIGKLADLAVLSDNLLTAQTQNWRTFRWTTP